MVLPKTLNEMMAILPVFGNWKKPFHHKIIVMNLHEIDCSIILRIYILSNQGYKINGFVDEILHEDKIPQVNL